MNNILPPCFMKTFTACALSALAAVIAATASAQTKPAAISATTTAIMLSDIHFDPFTTPQNSTACAPPALPTGKDPRRTRLPHPGRNLRATESQACAFRAASTLPGRCSNPASTAAHAQSPQATVRHRLRRPARARVRLPLPSPRPQERPKPSTAPSPPRPSPSSRSNCAAPSPASPVYLALGNNDSGCGDYREASNSAFLAHVSRKPCSATFTSPADRDAHRQAISRQRKLQRPAPRTHRPRPPDRPAGHVSVPRTTQAATASPTPRAGAAQSPGCAAQLAAARAHHEQVWVMAHIPPGVDVYSTTITTSERLRRRTARHVPRQREAGGDAHRLRSDVVRLAIFAHTHIDEMQLLAARTGSARVTAKLVPSISPSTATIPASSSPTSTRTPPRSRTTASSPPATAPASTPNGPRSIASPPCTTSSPPTPRKTSPRSSPASPPTRPASSRTRPAYQQNAFMLGGG